MNEPSAPFDEFGHPEQSVQEVRRGLAFYWARAGLQGFSFCALWIALLTAVFIVGLHIFRVLGGNQPAFLGTLKSAVPLIAIGISYISLIFTIPRTAAQRFLGFLVGLAFVLWGVEQFLDNQRWISFIDDIVVLLFVVDLSIVIREILARSSGERLLRKAGFPVVKTIDSFNFRAQPSIDESRVRGLLDGAYIERRENVVIVGHPGTGKTHLARSLGYAACLQGRRVRFMTASALASQLTEHHAWRSQRRFLRELDRTNLLIIDEVGYVPFTELEAQLMFGVISGAYERMSMIVTTTVPLERWAEVFGKERLAKGVLSRLTDRAHFLEATGEPYRKSRVQEVTSIRAQVS